MTKLVPFIVLLALFGCVHYDYKAREELKRHSIDNSRLLKYDLTIGVQCKDKTVSDAIIHVEDDLAAEFSVWLSDFLCEMGSSLLLTHVVNQSRFKGHRSLRIKIRRNIEIRENRLLMGQA